MNMLVGQERNKLVFNVAAIMNLAHANAKAEREYNTESYAVIFGKALKLAWGVAKLEMKDCSLVDGQLRIASYPIGGEKKQGELRSQW